MNGLKIDINLRIKMKEVSNEKNKNNTYGGWKGN